VYRHLLFNRLGRADDKLDPSILRLGTLLILFDVYITWARIERSNSSASGSNNEQRDGTRWALAEAPILLQYIFFLTMNILATIAQHAVIRWLSRFLMARFAQHSHVIADDRKAPETARPGRASPSAISTALLVSSCTKLFPILLVIWPSATSGTSNEQQGPGSGLGRAFVSNASNYTGWVVLLNNIEALLILLDCGYMVATSLALAGLMCRWTVEGWALSLVGLRNSSSREVFSNGLGFFNWSAGRPDS
jgi:lipid intermediate transporter